MKIIAVGDLHGKDCWKEIDFTPFDKVIFIGDYTDSFSATDDEIFSNLQEIVLLKKANREKFILLLGNHDVQYLHFPYFSCSGFRPTAQKQLTTFFKENRKSFQMAWEEKHHLFTHAGVSHSWFVRHEWLFQEYGFPKNNLSEV